MKKQEKKNKFVKFETSKLSASGSSKVLAGATCNTRSVCHVDGTADNDCVNVNFGGIGGLEILGF